jgi:excisionase family DNA binding protein
VDLIAAQAKGIRSQRPRTSVRREWIAPGPPSQIVVNVAPEPGRQKRPIDPLGRVAEGCDSDRLETKRGLARRLIPDQRNLPMQLVRVPVQRSLANGSNESVSGLQKYYSIKSVAHALDVSPRTVRRWIANGDLIATRINGVVRISEADFRAFTSLHREG